MLNPIAPCFMPSAERPASPEHPAASSTQRGAATSCPRVRSELLLGGGRELEIQHGDAVYRLRLTAMGKLILTK